MFEIRKQYTVTQYNAQTVLVLQLADYYHREKALIALDLGGLINGGSLATAAPGAFVTSPVHVDADAFAAGIILVDVFTLTSTWFFS